MQFVIGPHTSIARGYRRAAEEAAAIGANTFQFFTRNPRGGNAKALDAADVGRRRPGHRHRWRPPACEHASEEERVTVISPSSIMCSDAVMAGVVKVRQSWQKRS